MIDLNFMQAEAQKMGRLMAGVNGRPNEEDNNTVPLDDMDVIFHLTPTAVDVKLLTGKAYLFYASLFRLKPYPKEHETLSHWEWGKFRELLATKGAKYAQA